jgi:bifunctional non-homologous end joining protein LigD
MQVEDHPVEYKDFEGTIPKGEYGGGTVMIWDEGTYELLSDHPQKDLDDGKLQVALHGAKLDGEWTLVRMNRGAGKEWLLIKSGEDMRPVSKKKDNESAVTGRTMARIARDKDAEWR